MGKVGAWLNAARLRTLPLSISGILVGTALAASQGFSNNLIFMLALCTTIGLQITSNFANDYGDGVKGTDNNERIGPKRALQSGLLSASQLKKGIVVSVVINTLLILILVYVSFGLEQLPITLIFLSLGAFAIWAAIKYTVGKSAYGYYGLGDLFVFVFFGLVSVLGSMFLYTKVIPVNTLFPAISIGLLSVGVLNLNNLRDYTSDKMVGKNTVVVKMGFDNGKRYHYSLLVLSFISLLLYITTTNGTFLRYVCLFGYVPIVAHLKKVVRTSNAAELDPELKRLALSTFFTALLFYFSYYYFS